ncbi:hypothetical protein [uncultured Xylophilus sp.]|uniref:hypothetical protein n=1 Tax=uncultured Xylophilus sp. TaxID=296832 RepID=UPI0025CC6675|nr:hypothetical protein [uncultured Xylophilus sp.]
MLAMKQREDFRALIPADMRDADDLLFRYGRWAMDRYRYNRCASAEGKYQAPPSNEDREPRELLLSTTPAMRAHRALINVAFHPRQVLQILYVPKRLPAEAQLRIARIPARVCRELHMDGLRMFWTQHERLLKSAHCA